MVLCSRLWSEDHIKWCYTRLQDLSRVVPAPFLKITSLWQIFWSTLWLFGFTVFPFTMKGTSTHVSSVQNSSCYQNWCYKKLTITSLSSHSYNQCLSLYFDIERKILYSPFAFDKRVTFWFQCARSLHCVFVFAALYACAIVQWLHASLRSNTATYTQAVIGCFEAKKFTLLSKAVRL